MTLQSVVCLPLHKLKVAAEEQSVFEFDAGAARLTETLGKFAGLITATAFGNPHGDVGGQPAELTAQAKDLGTREALSDAIDVQREFVGYSPDVKILEGLH